MAEESTGNVETRLGQSAGPKATDADVSTQTSTLAGGEKSPSETATKNNSTNDTIKHESGAGKADNEGKTTTQNERRHSVDSGGDGHDGDGNPADSGSASPTTRTATDTANKPPLKPSAPLKKPTSFKSVSINKAYLEKATTATPPTATTKLAFSTEKGPAAAVSSSTTPALLGAKRRLVNKTVGTLQTGKGAGGAGAGGAKPAEQKVWTKNQPPPVISQKEMTDEELTKKFGIHISARLQTDNDKNEPSWGDEDDDEDWVPDVLQWTDPNKDAAQATTEETTPSKPSTQAVAAPVAPPPPPPAKEAEKPVPIQSQQPQPVAQPTIFHSSRPATLTTTKPTLVDKSAAAKPAGPPASPWAKLPPVKAVPPAAPLHTTPSAFPRPGDRFNDRGPSPHRRELHADDYGRSAWTERRPSHGTREIFNSRTGELEPVADRPRHESGRPQLRLNKPSVLQRNPSMSGPPAEPSPRFQSHGPGPDFRRQRTSSNVSGGSGAMGRKLSFTNTSHYGPNHSAIHDEEAPVHRPYQLSPSITHRSPVPVFSVPTTPGIAPDAALTPGASAVIAAELEQEKIMKEHAILAKQRRLAQEAEEEAAKRERLKKKLEELERLDNERKAKEKAEKDRLEAEARAAKEREEEEKREAERKRQEEIAAAKAAAEKEAADKLAAEKAAADAAAAAAAAAAKPAIEPYRPPQAQGQHSGRWQGQGQQHNGPYDSRSPRGAFATPHGPSQPNENRYSRWGPQQQQHQAPHQSSQGGTGGNIWGPIGERPRYSQQDLGPGPRQYSGYAPHQQTSPAPGSLPTDRYPHHGTRGQPPPDRRELPVSQIIPTAPRDLRTGYSPRVQNAQLQQQQQQQPQHHQQQQPSFPQQDGSQMSAQTTPVEPSKTAMSWRRPSFPDQQQPQQKAGFERTGSHQDMEPRTGYSSQGPSSANAPQRQVPTGPPQPRLIPTGPSNRASRFFPDSANLVLNHLGDQVQKENTSNQDISQSEARSPPSPPPPACPVSPEPNHSPVVRLPPISVPQGSPTERNPQGLSSGYPKEHPRSPRAHSGIDAFTAVQNRIREKIQAAHQAPQPIHASPTRTFAKPERNHSIDAQVAATSKVALDSVEKQPVTVSLPGIRTTDDPLALEPFTRPITEETLFGEMFAQTFGSLPIVRIPKNLSPVILEPAPPPPVKAPKSKPRLKVESIDTFHIAPIKDLTDKDGIRFIPVQLPGSEARKEVPFTATTSGNFRKGKDPWRAGKGGPKRSKGHGSGSSSPAPNSPRVNGPVTYTRQHSNGGIGMAGASRMMTEPVQ